MSIPIESEMEFERDSQIFENSPIQELEETRKSVSIESVTYYECDELIIKKKKTWLRKRFDQIFGVSDDTREHFKEIYSEMKLLFSGLSMNPITLTTGLMIIGTYHSEKSVRTGLIETNLKLVKELLHICQLSNASYGWKLVYGYQGKGEKYVPNIVKGITDNDATSTQIILDHLRIKKEDILETKWINDQYVPAHFIAYDHSIKSIILSIRGTLSIRDALTDMVVRYEEFQDGSVHSGIFTAARKKYPKIVPTLLNAIETHPDYKVILTGHSLGGGVATMIGYMLREQYPHLNVHCYTFGCPAILSLNLANSCKPWVTSVVLNDDMICRTSRGSVRDLKLMLKHVIKNNQGNMQRLFHVASADGSFSPKWTDRITTTFNWSPSPDLGRLEGTERLYPPGKVYHIYNADGQYYNTMEESNPSLFGDIMVTSSMLVDHLPNAYEDCLYRVHQTLENPFWDIKKRDHDMREKKKRDRNDLKISNEKFKKEKL